MNIDPATADDPRTRQLLEMLLHMMQDLEGPSHLPSRRGRNPRAAMRRRLRRRLRP